MIAGKDIVLRAIEPEDLEFLFHIENDPYMWIYSTHKEPYSRYAIRQYIKHCDKTVFERGQLRFIITKQKSNKPIGCIDIFEFDYVNKKAEIGIFIDTPYRKNGYAIQAIELLCYYAKAYIGLHQLYAFISIDNIASKTTFKKAFFKQTCIIKDWCFFMSKYHDIELWQRIL